MPTKKMPRGERLPLAYPVTDEMKNRIKAAVVAECERVTGKAVTNHTETIQTRAETRHENTAPAQLKASVNPTGPAPAITTW
jgi:hypothetical protein